ncbi:armadillo-type protein [Xylariales sp. PMI_506]|nr:armadillo-type protein [Xylariales sp. PMI_506]
MPKPRTKRQAIREERKQKQRDRQPENDDATQSSKRRRLDDAGNANSVDNAYESYNNGPDAHESNESGLPEREFFGMLSDQEQEYFRSVDEQLDIDDFPSQEERNMYLANVFVEAQGKELKLACSQSCSRLMERLILMSNTRQKKKLFEQFASHFLNLIQHRFASHCCETLFLQSAPIVTKELGGEVDDAPEEGNDENAEALPSMEDLFLLTLDELEGNLSYLLTDRFASHTLRVLLIILSGRPLDQSKTKSLIHSKKKEKISAPWVSDVGAELNNGLRAVPSSFTIAAKKIIIDSTSGMDATALRVLATHPTGNPVLQLLLELDISMNSRPERTKGEEPKVEEEQNASDRLLWRLLPDAPASLKESDSPATEFINAMTYDPIGSRLLETLVTHCPGKLFKVLFKQIFSDRIQSLARNDIASYPAIRILSRLGKEDLVASIKKILPEMPKLVSLSRFNVIKALFERCQAREAGGEITGLLRALTAACGSDYKALIPRLCIPEDGDEKAKEKQVQKSLTKSQSALVSHGSQLASTLLSIPGPTSNAIQSSLMSLPAESLVSLATTSGPTAHVIITALATPAQNKAFHKIIVAAITRDAMALALSEHGGRVLGAVVSVPSRGNGISLPFHVKEQIMNQLGQGETELRDTYEGRRVWRTWRGDVWKTRRTDWISWAKEIDADVEAPAPVWQKKKAPGAKGADNPNAIRVNETARKRKRENGVEA